MTEKENKKFEAFKLLGRTCKYLQSSLEKTEETEISLHRTMAKILKELTMIMPDIRKENPEMVDMFDYLLEVY